MTEVDAFLEHHGIKGQKWGIRNKKQKQPKTEWQKRQRNANLAVIGITAVLAGAVLAEHILKRKSVRFGSIKQMPFEPAKRFTEEQVRKHRHDIVARNALKAIPMGPIGSTSIPRLRGAIPL